MTEKPAAVPTETATGRRVVYAPEFYGELVEWRDNDMATARRVVRLVEHAIPDGNLHPER